MNDSRIFLPLIGERAREIDRQAQRLGPNVVALRERPARSRPPESVTVRPAHAADGPRLHHVAQLDSAVVPDAPLLVAERAGSLVAALSLADGAVVADPFVPTADVVDLLRLRARQLGSGAGTPRAHARGLLGWRLARERGA